MRTAHRYIRRASAGELRALCPSRDLLRVVVHLNFSRQPPEWSGRRFWGKGPRVGSQLVANAPGDTATASGAWTGYGVSLSAFNILRSRLPAPTPYVKYQRAALPVCDRQRLQLEGLRQSHWRRLSQFNCDPYNVFLRRCRSGNWPSLGPTLPSPPTKHRSVLVGALGAPLVVWYSRS